MTLSFIKDKNGNKKIEVATTKGSFSIQTNGNLPAIHCLNKDELNANHDLALSQIQDYVNEFGTKRQKQIINN